MSNTAGSGPRKNIDPSLAIAGRQFAGNARRITEEYERRMDVERRTLLAATLPFAIGPIKDPEAPDADAQIVEIRESVRSQMLERIAAQPGAPSADHLRFGVEICFHAFMHAAHESPELIPSLQLIAMLRANVQSDRLITEGFANDVLTSAGL